MPRSQKYTSKMFDQDLSELSNLIDSYVYTSKGGRAPVHTRSFKVHSVEGKPYTGKKIRVEINIKKPGRPMRKNPAKPKDAALHAYHSICDNLRFKKLNCDITFKIQETTQNSKKKIYGPYEATTKKISGALLKTYTDKYKKGEMKFVPKTVTVIRKIDRPKKGGAKKKSKKSKKKSKKKSNNKKKSNKKKKSSKKKAGGFYFYN